MKLKDACSLKRSYDQPRQHIEKQRHYFANKCPSSQSYGFSSSHVWKWELDHEEGWMLKNWCFWLWCWRRLLRVLLTARKSNQSILKEINPEYSLERLMLTLKLQHFGHLLQKSWLTGKDPDAGKGWGQEKGTTEDKMVGWHHWLNGHEFEQAPGDSERQWNLACCSPWACRVRDDWMTEQQQKLLMKNITKYDVKIRHIFRN